METFISEAGEIIISACTILWNSNVKQEPAALWAKLINGSLALSIHWKEKCLSELCRNQGGTWNKCYQ